MHRGYTSFRLSLPLVQIVYLYHNKTGLEDLWGAEILYGSDNLFKNWAICFPSMSP